MLPGLDAIADDGGLAQRLGGFKPVQTLDQDEARAILAHQDRRLLALREHAVRDRIDALRVERFAPPGKVAQLRVLFALTNCSTKPSTVEGDDELVVVAS